MKLYKLLKDLPRAKAGEVVIITNAHSNNPGILKINKWNEDETQRPRLAFIHTKNMDEWLEEIREPKSVWGLKDGDEYFCLESDGVINSFKWDGDTIDYDCRRIGNVFLTQEEAEKERDKRKAIVKIQKYCFENGIDNSWSEIDRHCTFSWNFTTNKIAITFCAFLNKIYSPIGYFSCEEATKILENFPEELKLIYS